MVFPGMLARKHVLEVRSGQKSEETAPDYVNWRMFRFAAENDTNSTHLDALESLLLETTKRGQTVSNMVPEFGDIFAVV